LALIAYRTEYTIVTRQSVLRETLLATTAAITGVGLVTDS
jgi:hypothetical protein